MLLQDIDPLADTIPPRHAYESDEEDEPVEFTQLPSESSRDVSVKIELLEGIKGKQVELLLIVTGNAGALWARGAALGEQVGQIMVEDAVIGFIFSPVWASNSLVLISEPFAKLPIWAMYPYAEAVLNRWKASRIAILDAYSTATYITSSPIPHHEAPIRYLHSAKLETSYSGLESSNVQRFSPPNLLQTTSASFLSILVLPHWKDATEALVILLPSPRTPKPVPRKLESSEANVEFTLSQALENTEGWDAASMEAAHKILQQFSNSSENTTWLSKMTGSTLTSHVSRHKRSDLEESMYI